MRIQYRITQNGINSTFPSIQCNPTNNSNLKQVSRP